MHDRAFIYFFPPSPACFWGVFFGIGGGGKLICTMHTAGKDPHWGLAGATQHACTLRRFAGVCPFNSHKISRLGVFFEAICLNSCFARGCARDIFESCPGTLPWGSCMSESGRVLLTFTSVSWLSPYLLCRNKERVKESP